MMKRSSPFAIVLATLAMVSPYAAQADELKLKDGTKIAGTIVGFEENSFKVKTNYGFAVVQKDQVLSISITGSAKKPDSEKKSEPSAEKPAPPAPAVNSYKKYNTTSSAPPPAAPLRVAFHPPCTLQHALRASGVIEPLLQVAGYTLTTVADGGRCCGSAGTYSVLQPQLARRLLRAKVSALEADAPQLIATANIGCLAHLRSGTTLPVCHWVELIASRLDGG